MTTTERQHPFHFGIRLLRACGSAIPNGGSLSLSLRASLSLLCATQSTVTLPPPHPRIIPFNYPGRGTTGHYCHVTFITASPSSSPAGAHDRPQTHSITHTHTHSHTHTHTHTHTHSLTPYPLEIASTSSMIYSPACSIFQ